MSKIPPHLSGDTDHGLFIHSRPEGHLCHFQVWMVVNKGRVFFTSEGKRNGPNFRIKNTVSNQTYLSLKPPCIGGLLGLEAPGNPPAWPGQQTRLLVWRAPSADVGRMWSVTVVIL